jgi:DNA invertase Pin-like site-specific DNA recombinase
MKNVIELVRVSTEQQAGEDRGGIPAQRQSNLQTAERFGLHIVESIEIVDVSGSNVMATPEMQYLLGRLPDPGIHGVVAKEFSRLIRPDGFEHLQLFKAFLQHSIVFYLPSGPIDVASDDGSLMGMLQGWMAGRERKQILARMMDAKEALRRQGKHPSGASTLPYGVAYDRQVGKWSYTPEASKVREIFEKVLQGETNYQELSRQTGMARTNVRYLLTNPIYAGWRVYDTRRDPSPAGLKYGVNGRQGERRKIKRGQAEVVRLEVINPPLVSMVEFEAVQGIIERKRAHNWRTRSKPSAYTYNGHLCCGECGEPLYTHTGKQEFYVCKSRHTRARQKRMQQNLPPCDNRYMLRSKLEPALDDLLAGLASDRTFLGKLLASAETRFQGSAAVVAGASGEAYRQRLQAKRDTLIDMCVNQLISKAEFQSRSAALEAEQRRAEKKPAKSAVDVESLKDRLQSILKPFMEWQFLNREEKRRLLRGMDARFSVSKYRVKEVEFPLNEVVSGSDIASRSKTAR